LLDHRLKESRAHALVGYALLVSAACASKGVARVARVVVAVVIGVGAFGAGTASAASRFPSAPMLDDFTADAALSTTNWATPALGEGVMALDPVGHQLTGVDFGTWDAALWKRTAFAGPVEVWATLNRAGQNDANLYADVAGGGSGSVHPNGGYFADFGGPNSTGSPGQVSLWRINGPQKETLLFSVNAPYVNLTPGDEIGLSVSKKGVLVAWYKPVTGSWSAVLSWRDVTYSRGSIAIEAIPGTAYGFRNFGGGTTKKPVISALTRTTVNASAATATVGRKVTYTARITPSPRAGTVSFLDGTSPIPDCSAQPVRAGGKATCTVEGEPPGKQTISARYSGSPDAAFAGSGSTKAVSVLWLARPTWSLAKRRLLVTVPSPPGLQGASVAASAVMTLRGAGARFSVRTTPERFPAGETRTLSLVLTRHDFAGLRAYVRHHHNARINVTVTVVVRAKKGVTGRLRFTFRIDTTRDLSRLGLSR
jgi:Bacterial Ig-like domain (group 3)